MNSVLPLLMPTQAYAPDPEIGWNIFYYSGFVFCLVFLFAALARKGFTKRTFTYMPTRMAEHLIVFLESMALNVIGPHGRKYVPFLLALWLYIFISNITGLFLNYTPSAEWSLNLSLAIITWVFVQYEGIKANGLKGHLSHFAGPKQTGIFIAVSVIIFFIEIISECMKIVSLSLRLYGNIHGGHIVVACLNDLGGFVPLGGLLLPLKFFTCVIQAYVFVMLTCLYLSLVTSHGDDGDHEHDNAAESHGARFSASSGVAS
jgi:F-type H+-transporting ATPase subunit a